MVDIGFDLVLREDLCQGSSLNDVKTTMVERPPAQKEGPSTAEGYSSQETSGPDPIKPKKVTGENHPCVREILPLVAGWGCSSGSNEAF